jgi:hypothetical protein
MVLNLLLFVADESQSSSERLAGRTGWQRLAASNNTQKRIESHESLRSKEKMSICLRLLRAVGS